MSKRSNDEALEPMRRWLADRKARLAWSKKIEGVGAASAYVVNMHVVIVHVFRRPSGEVTGWEAYVAASESSEDDAMITALDQHCFDGDPAAAIERKVT